MSTIGDASLNVNGQQPPTRPNSSSQNGHPSGCSARPPTAPNLTIIVNGQTFRFPPEILADETEVARIRLQCQSANTPPVISIEHMLDWDDQARWATLNFIASLSNYRVRICDDGAEFQNMFEAVLGMLVGALNPERCERVVQAAIQAVALIYPTAIRPACSRIKDQLDELGVRGYRVDALVRQAEQLRLAVRQTQAVATVGIRLVHDILPEAPVPENTVVPQNWNLSTTGISVVIREAAGIPAVSREAEIVIPAPILIKTRFTDVQSGAESLELTWFKDGRWQFRIVPRAMVASTGRLSSWRRSACRSRAITQQSLFSFSRILRP